MWSYAAAQAAVTVARRVAQECSCELGQKVGYAVRFEERASSKTRIKYLTGVNASDLPETCTQPGRCLTLTAHFRQRMSAGDVW